MPIYEYTCEACGSKFAKLVRSASGSSEVVCPTCGDENCKRAVSTFSASTSASGSSSSYTSSSSCGGGGRFT